MHRAGDAVEPCVERRDDRGRRRALGQRGEAAQVGEQERRLDGLADAAPERTGEHARGAAPAEIGLERRGQRGAGAERGERRRREARRLTQALGLVGRERARARPSRASARPAPARPRLHARARRRGPPASAGRLRPAGRPLPGPRAPSHKSERLDHLAASRPPQPGAPGDERMGRRQRQGAARERRAVLDQAACRDSPEKAPASASRRPRRPARRGLKKAASIDHRLEIGSLSISVPGSLSDRDQGLPPKRCWSASTCVHERLVCSQIDVVGRGSLGSARQPTATPIRSGALSVFPVETRAAVRTEIGSHFAAGRAIAREFGCGPGDFHIG